MARLRQSRSDRRLRRRRRRGRDRPAGDLLALQQIPQSRARWRGAADPASQRLQDRQSDRARAHRRTTSCERCFVGYGYEPLFRRGRRSRDDAPADGGDARHGVRRDRARSRQARAQRRPAERPRWPMIVLRTPEGLDRPEGGRRQARPKASGARIRCRSRHASKPEHVAHAGRLDAQLPARRAVRRERARCGRRSPRSRRRASGA